MNRRCIAVLWSVLLGIGWTIAQNMGIAPEEYRARRARVMERMDTLSVAVFRATDPARRNGDVNFKYRQSSNFLYLTGGTEWSTTLLLVPSGILIDSATTVREVLFVTPGGSQWTGDRMGVDGAMKELGFGAPGTSSAALAHDRFADILSRAIAGKKVLYYTHTLPEALVDPVSGKRFITAREIKNELKAKYPDLEVKSLNSVLGELRSIKSPAELALLQKAIDVTAVAHVEAMKSCEPGMFEYQLQAVIEYSFARLGAEFTGFPSIVGSGANSLILHYEENRRQMENGDVVVMDLGAEYHGYSADVTRTIPVNGKFTTAQRALYEIVLAANDAAAKEMKMGAPAGAPGKKAFDVLAEGLMNLGIIKDRNEVNRYCPHGVSHPIGLEVHDVGAMGASLQAGMVLTMEPGLYVPNGSPCDKRYWNIGVRIEDDVLVTPDGPKLMSGNAPRTIKEIEAVMRLRGIGNQPVGVKKAARP
jgi:Xaa-Pro aminopeptidase